MPRYVLTGAPGAGKTAILRLLERAGHQVVAEAATDVIALEQALGRPEPWMRPGFTERSLLAAAARGAGWRRRPGALPSSSTGRRSAR